MSETKSTRAVSGALARRIIGPVVLVAMLVTAVAVGGPGAGADATPPVTAPPSLPSGSSTSSRPSTTGGPTTEPATTEPDPTGTSSTASPTVSPTDGTSGRPVSGVLPGVDLPGVSMSVSPRQSGDLDVQQTVWLNAPITEVQVAPPDLSSAGASFATQTPSIVGLTLSAEGRPIPLQSTEVTEARSIPLAAPASTFVVSYTLKRSVVRSRPSVAGRALGAIRPLQLTADPQLNVMVDIPGRSVLSVVCPELGTAGVANCAGPTDSGYRLSNPIPLSTSLLLVQLDLDRAS